jgi:hypothetical protein
LGQKRRLRQRSRHEIVFFTKKKRLRQRSQQKTLFSIEKKRLRQRSPHKKCSVAPISVQDVDFFQYFQIYHAKKWHDFAIYGGYHATLILQCGAYDLLDGTRMFASEP